MPPFVGSYFYLWDANPKDETNQDDWNNIPDGWRKSRFDAVDILFILPFRATPQFGFDLGTCSGNKCNLQKRFEWVVSTARSQKPSILIFASHFYGNDIDGNGFKDLNTVANRTTFANSLATWFQTQATKTLKAEDGKEVSARIDGYDVDVECAGGNRTGSAGTKVDWLVDVMAAVRSALDGITSGSKFYTSICVAWNDDLDKIAQGPNGKSLAHYVDYVNMQRYDGGNNKDGSGTPSAYMKKIPDLKPGQLTYGASIEQTNLNAKSTYEDIITDYEAGYKDPANSANNGPFGGFWTYRLNNGTCIFTNVAQVALYNKIKGADLQDAPNLAPNAPSLAKLTKAWPDGVHLQDSKDPFEAYSN